MNFARTLSILVCALFVFPVSFGIADVLDESQPRDEQFPIDPIGCEFADSIIVRNERDAVCGVLCDLQTSVTLAQYIDQGFSDKNCSLLSSGELSCSIAEGQVQLVEELEPVSGIELYAPDTYVQERFNIWSDGISSCGGFGSATELKISEPLYVLVMPFYYRGDSLSGTLTLEWDDSHSSVKLIVSK